MILTVVLTALYLLAVGSLISGTWRTRISPIPTTARAMDRALELVPADLTGPIVDLGSGWGTAARALARRYPDSSVIGYEISLVPWLWAVLRGFLGGPANLVYRRRNFFEESLAGTSLVYCYLHTAAMRRLASKFDSELGAGAFVLSNEMPIDTWTPAATAKVGNFFTAEVYLYRV